MFIRAVVIAAVIATCGGTAAAQERGRARGPVFAVEGGVARVTGSGSTVYGLGFGRAFVLGYRLGYFTIEWHFGQTYRASPDDDVLEGDKTQGDIGVSTVGLRFSLGRRNLVLSGFGGVTRAAVPLLSLTDEAEVRSSRLSGVGPIGGGGVALPLQNGSVLVGGELRGAYVLWEQPEYPYVSAIEPVNDSTVRFEQSVADIDGMVWTLTLSVRAIL